MKDPNMIEIRRPDGSLDVGTRNLEPSKTQQQFADESDINNIMAKYQNTGEWQGKTGPQGQYRDFSQITDYKDMVDTVMYAQEAFASLPAKIRSRFRNDPGQLLTFLQDKANYDEGVKLGLIQPLPSTPTPSSTPPIPTPTPSSTPPIPTPTS